MDGAPSDKPRSHDERRTGGQYSSSRGVSSGEPRGGALDGARLRALALAYAARYATSRGRLSAYLVRRVARSGWDEAAGDVSERIAALIEEFTEKAYVDDQAYAQGRAVSMRRRGYGTRRIGAALRDAGIDPDQRAAVLAETLENDAIQAAHRYAKRRRLGPYAPQPMDARARQRAIAAMVRAGHEFAAILMVLDARDDVGAGKVDTL